MCALKHDPTPMISVSSTAFHLGVLVVLAVFPPWNERMNHHKPSSFNNEAYIGTTDADFALPTKCCEKARFLWEATKALISEGESFFSLKDTLLLFLKLLFSGQVYEA